MNHLEVKVVPHMLKQKTRWGMVQVQHGLSYVLVNGSSAGYVPIAGQYKGIFHPMPGFPQELCEEVVKESKGELVGTLKAPKRAQLPDDIEEDELEDTDVFDGDDDA